MRRAFPSTDTIDPVSRGGRHRFDKTRVCPRAVDECSAVRRTFTTILSRKNASAWPFSLTLPRSSARSTIMRRFWRSPAVAMRTQKDEYHRVSRSVETSCFNDSSEGEFGKLLGIEAHDFYTGRRRITTANSLFLIGGFRSAPLGGTQLVVRGLQSVSVIALPRTGFSSIFLIDVIPLGNRIRT
ncbi:hypothetical protein FF011L_27230 [Roseimaritima multifibrata]|uniref:Uncharacterized protein n=1 Tax=Roseimaritima multifibrata TaxID=1930274 RepID=A0A517MGF2_9BACT|nr:hypothetical protein FF011L_27230 [Roseimaritima multifibrata]